MEKQLFLFIIFIGGIWLILDQFYGQKRISSFVQGLTGFNKAPDIPAGKTVVA